MTMQKWSLALGSLILLLASALSYAGNSEREVYFYKCTMAVPRAGNMTTWGMSEGLGKTGKAARNAAFKNCLNQYDSLAPGICRETAYAGQCWNCDVGIWIPFSESAE